MEQNTLDKSVVLGVAVAVVLLVGVFLLFSEGEANLQGLSPQVAQQATSASVEVGQQEIITIFNNKSLCANRSVGTTDQEIMVTFSGTPTATFGHPIAASTTKEFPSEQYGCGDVKVYAEASTTITHTETTW